MFWILLTAVVILAVLASMTGIDTTQPGRTQQEDRHAKAQRKQRENDLNEALCKADPSYRSKVRWSNK